MSEEAIVLIKDFAAEVFFLIQGSDLGSSCCHVSRELPARTVEGKSVDVGGGRRQRGGERRNERSGREMRETLSDLLDSETRGHARTLRKGCDIGTTDRL